MQSDRMDDSKNSNDERFDFDDEEDDYLLAEAVEASISAHHNEKIPLESGFDDYDEEEIANISFGIDNSTAMQTNKVYSSGFDTSSGQIWIYPTNYPIRDYQYNIVQQALHRNTLVVLPTGLGKTFIAAVVMYNLYRWFPQGKVVFMAPTKPLVAQQIHACYTITGIPKKDTVEMTGNMHPSEREKKWREKRVIFLTPQVMTNDLSRGSFAATSIKCLVVDEAHKATGNHAYCQVVRELLNFAQDFRVLALSATPGSDLKKVQQVVTNLLIAHIELRSEESMDIRPYTHERQVDKIVVPMGEELSGIRLKYIQIMDSVVKRLIRNKVLYNREATKLSKFLILKARDEFRQNPPQNLQGPMNGQIEGDFAMAMSLYHGFELLQLHGLRSLHNFLSGIQAGHKGYGRTRYELARNADFNDIMESLQEKFASKILIGKGDEKDQKIAVGHPKMHRLEEIVVEHFKSFQEKNMDTRVMIFSQYRDSVEEIRCILNQHQPLVKVMAFIGQSSVGKSSKGYSQKEQLKVMKQFREGGYNALVSTCVGEEGLDIGDVDLIVCFDAHKDPTRLVQRMGRTGRKRKGRIVMLVTQGKEEQIYNQSLYSKKSVHKAILNGAKTLHFYPHNPPLIPPGIKPKCHKMFITVKPDEDGKTSQKTKNKEKSRKSLNANQTISNAFSKARSKQSSSELSHSEYDEIRHEFCQISKTSKHLPRPKCTILSQNVQEEDEFASESLIDLSEWTPWQNRLQRTHLVGHSTRSQHLVQVCEFIELQQSIGEEGNSYGLEMKLYLNKVDVLKSSSMNESTSNVPGQSSITSFFTPSQTMKQGNQSSSRDPEILQSKKSANGMELDGKKVSKGKKRLKDKFSDIERSVGCSENDGNNYSSSKTVTKPRGSNRSSNLFTVLKPVVEERGDANIDNVNTCNEVIILADDESENVTVRKKKGKKKKLLDTNDYMWKNDNLNRSKISYNKSKIRIMEILRSDVKEQEDENVDEDFTDFEVDVAQQKKEGKVNSMNESSSLTHEREHCRIQNVTSGCYDNPTDVGTLGSDVEEMIEPVEEGLLENGTDICSLIPMPPRIEEVAELFEQLQSPLDFLSVDIYQLVDKWRKTEPCWKFLNPLNVSASQSDFVKDTVDKNDYLYVNDDIDVDVDENTEESKHLSKFRMFEKDKEEDNNVLINTGLHLPVRTVRVPDKDQKQSFQLEKFNGNIDKSVCDNLLLDGCKPSSAARPSSSCLVVCKSKKQSMELGPSLIEHQNIKGSIATSKESSSKRFNNSKMLSPNKLIDSMDEVMQAIDVECYVFSPPTKTVSKTKPADISLKNVSLQSQSFATFSQALACLHSSSDSLLSPTNSAFGKSDLRSPGQERDYHMIENAILPEKRTKPLKVKGVALSPAEVKSSLGVVSTPVPANETCLNKTSRQMTPDRDERRTSGLETRTPKKVADIEFDSLYDLNSEDEFGLDIIPPTPHKSNSGVSLGSSQLKQASMIKRRSLHTYSPQNRDYPWKEKAPPKNFDENGSNSTQYPVSSKSPGNKVVYVIEENHSEPGFNDDHMSPTLNDNDGCVIVTPPPKRKKLPFSSNDNTDCIEILSSPSPEHLFSPLSSPQRNETALDATIPPRVNSMSNMKKKRLSLKTGNSNMEEHQTPSSRQNAPCLNKRAGQVCASTPLTKELENDPTDTDKDAMLNMDNLTPIKGHLPNEDDAEESFIIRRKRKPTTALDFSSDNEMNPKNSWLNSRGKTEEKKSRKSSSEKSKSFEEWQASCFDCIEDDDDFEEPGQVASKSKPYTAPSKKDKPVKRKKRGANFIEDEAEVSGDAETSDENEGDEEDFYEQSFINNDTEMTQAENTDMRAVYLKSVRSPVRGRYKLQFNCASNSNIYSQALPDDQGLSEYEEDSFCVGSEEEEEDSPLVVKNSKKTEKLNRKKGKPKRRVQMLSNSSSEEENALPFTQEFTTNQRAIAQKALLSSSGDESDFEYHKKRRKINAVNDSDNVGDNLNYEIEKSPFTSPVGRVVENNVSITGKSKLSSVATSVSKPNTNINAKIDLKPQASHVIEDLPMAGLDEWLDDFDATEMDCSSKTKTASFQETKRNKAFIDDDFSVPESDRNSRDGYKKSTGLRLPHHQASFDKAISNSTFSSKPYKESETSSGFSTVDESCASYRRESLTKGSELTLPGRDLAREERLKRQKEKQERFRQKLAQVQQTSCVNISKTDEVTKTQTSYVNITKADEVTKTQTSYVNITKADEVTKSHSSPAVCPNIPGNVSITAGKEVLQILVDSKEISGAQEVISALRLKHGVSVTARQIGSCDYVLSNHLVIDRMCWSAFSNGSNRSKLTSRLCEMQVLYRKCALVIETDKVKPGLEKHRKPLQRTKYLDRTMACIIQTGVKIYFTDSAEQTATLLSELCQIEQRKGRHLAVPTKLNPKKEGMFSFVTSIPQINIMEALNLINKYSNVAEIISSPVSLLQKRGCLPSEKAQWVYNYFRHKFDLQMTPVSHV